MKNEEKHQRDPQEDFIGTVGEINDLLAKLQQRANNHFNTDPETIDWADVGSLNYVKSQLQQLLRFVEGAE